MKRVFRLEILLSAGNGAACISWKLRHVWGPVIMTLLDQRLSGARGSNGAERVRQVEGEMITGTMKQ